ncbi:MAG: UDP-N-acetylmuramoyl-L-alanyl-D-glutamate--2,6-diaminopimelate ligase [bacterium]|nr:UDP-N-acetylmuramoyl-L-alanyl-D-glutamate--2,6-diaminopimelate ligase [bacterium]
MRFYLQRVKNIYHLFKALIACVYYQFPSNHITVIGVTGTDGKTTTASLIYHILISAGKKVSMISTVSATIAGKEFDTGFHVTTPSPFAVQKYLKQAVRHGDEYFVLETTSHALDQSRVYGVKFAFGILTNITHEHLHYHQSFEHYVASKMKLLQNSQTSIVNKDDSSFTQVQNLKFKIQNVKSYGLKKADYSLDISKHIGKELESFNQYNYLAAYALGKEVGLDDNVILSAMKKFTLPQGRMEVVYDKDYTVIVDFAHTPNALHEALKSIRHQYLKRRIIHIFGAAAYRDDTKRPLMGKESASFSDIIIITEEDYRTENPDSIAKQIASGIESKRFIQVDPSQFGNHNKQYTIIHERIEAIRRALSIVQKGDVLVLTGKGHEKSLNRDGKEYVWNDKDEVLKIVEREIIR